APARRPARGRRALPDARGTRAVRRDRPVAPLTCRTADAGTLPAMAQKKWSDLSTPAKVAVVVGSLVELALTAVAMRDLSKRSADEVRGPKWIWRLVSLVQPVGPILYLVLGRRSA